MIQLPSQRPLVYFGGGYDGLETGLDGSVMMADIDEAGAINVAGSLGAGQLTRVTPADIRFWNPDDIISQQRSFYGALLRHRYWRGLAAVRNKRVFLEPTAPFGWLDDPPSVNRLIGLYWLSSLFYQGVAAADLRTLVSGFYQTFYDVKLTDPQLNALLRTAEPPPPPAPTAPQTTPRPSSPQAIGIPGLPGIGALPATPSVSVPSTTPAAPSPPPEAGVPGVPGIGNLPTVPGAPHPSGRLPNPGAAPATAPNP